MPSDFNVVWLVVVGVLGVVGTLYTLFSNMQRNKRDETKEATLNTKVITILENDVQHIRRNTDELRVEGKQQSEKFDKFAERINEKYNELTKDLLSVRSDLQTHVELQAKHEATVEKRLAELESKNK